MLTLPYSWSRSSKDHDLYIHLSTLAIDASRQSYLKSVDWFQRRFLKGFYPYMGMATILEKKIFEGLLPYIGMAAILVM